FQEAVLRAVWMVRAPDGVEAVAHPGAGKVGQRTERIGGSGGGQSRCRLRDLRYPAKDEIPVGLCDCGLLYWCHGDGPHAGWWEFQCVRRRVTRAQARSGRDTVTAARTLWPAPPPRTRQPCPLPMTAHAASTGDPALRPSFTANPLPYLASYAPTVP